MPPKKTPVDKPFVKSSRAEVEARVSTVFGLIVAGCSTGEIVRYVAEKTTWGVARRQIEEYIAAATVQFTELSRASRAAEVGKALARLNDLYGKSMRIQDYKACLAMQKEIGVLLALNAPAATGALGEDDGDGPPTRVVFTRSKRNG